jgi:hypothetical protein
MGRQTAVALSEEDEEVFLAFLRAESDVRIYRRSAPSAELLVVPEFPPRGSGEMSYRLWNAAFPWKPEYGRWQTDTVLVNTAGAPLLEYSRHAFDNPNPLVHGRIYWNTDFAIYHGLEYDREAFGRWYDQLIRWLRRNGTRVEIAKNWHQYWLPGAWGAKI